MTQPKKESNIWPTIKKYRKEIFAGFLIIIAILFLVKNAYDVTFHLVFFKIQVPLIILLTIFAAIGAGIVAVYWRFSHQEQKFKIRELQMELERQKTTRIEPQTPKPKENSDSSDSGEV